MVVRQGSVAVERAARAVVMVGALACSLGLVACTDDERGDVSTPDIISIPASTDAPVASESLPSGDTTQSPGNGPSPDTVPIGTGTATDKGFALLPDGLGDLAFGTAPEVVVETLSPTFDIAPTSDDFEFSIDAGEVYLTGDEAFGFAFPIGRRVCWDSFCVSFGSRDGSPLGFAGWSYRPAGEAFVSLATDDGITIGSRWTDHLDRIVAEKGGCGEFGFAKTVDGVDLGLRGGVWTTGDGETVPFEEFLPDPSLVSVYRMQAGSNVFAAEENC